MVEIPGIPKKLWQSVALINLIPEITSYAIFKDLNQVLSYVVACVVIVTIVFFLEKGL